MNIKKRTETFLNSAYFVALVAAAVFLSWYFKNYTVGLIILSVLFTVIILFFRDTSPLIPLVILSTFMFDRKASEIDIKGILTVIIPLIVSDYILHFIIYRPKIEKGRYFYGFLFALIAMCLGGLGFSYKLSDIFATAGLTLLAFYIYVFTNSTARDIKKTVLDSFIAVTVIIILQLLVYYLNKDNITIVLRDKLLDLGWGISNNIGMVLSMLLPVTFYKALTSKNYYFFVILAFLQLLGLCCTLSRGNILFGGIFFVILFIICLIKTKHKTAFILTALAAAAAASLFVYYAYGEFFSHIIWWLKKVSFDDRGRFELFYEAVENFKLNPIFGTGFFYKYDVIPHWYHNTLLQILASLGVFGVICYCPYFYQRYMVPLKKFNFCNFFMLCAILLSELYGMVDCNFFFIYNALFIVYISIIIESEKDTVNIFKLRSLKKSIKGGGKL